MQQEIRLHKLPKEIRDFNWHEVLQKIVSDNYIHFRFK
jgi:hypothetical protein